MSQSSWLKWILAGTIVFGRAGSCWRATKLLFFLHFKGSNQNVGTLTPKFVCRHWNRRWFDQQRCSKPMSLSSSCVCASICMHTDIHVCIFWKELQEEMMSCPILNVGHMPIPLSLLNQCIWMLIYMLCFPTFPSSFLLILVCVGLGALKSHHYQHITFYLRVLLGNLYCISPWGGNDNFMVVVAVQMKKKKRKEKNHPPMKYLEIAITAWE